MNPEEKPNQQPNQTLPAPVSDTVANPTAGTTTPNPETTDLEGIPKKVKFLHDIVLALVFVLFIGFAGMFVATATMLIDAWRARGDSYNQLENQVLQQNLRIEALLNEIHQLNQQGAVSSTPR